VVLVVVGSNSDLVKLEQSQRGGLEGEALVGSLSLEIFDNTGWKFDGLLCGFDTLPTLHGRTHRNLGSKERDTRST